MASNKLDQKQLAALQAEVHHNRQQVPIPQLRKLLEHDLEMIQTQMLIAVSVDDLRTLQGEGKRIKKIIDLFDKQPLDLLQQAAAK